MSSQGFCREQGISVVLVALLLPVLFIFLGFVVFVGYSSLVRNELQSAADAAAHAGATILCSTRECFTGSRDTVAWTISHHIAHSRFGNSADLNFSYQSTDPGPVWTASNLVVGIERGRWTPESNFVSLEGWDDSTSANYQPGMVGYVTSNAIRVSIRRVRSTAGFGYFLGQEADIVAAATAVNDTPQRVCAAPFAIPLCAVINSNGNFDPEKINNNTRYFTGVERHCHGQSKYCNNLPSFPIEPTTESDVIREYYPIVPMPDMPSDFNRINTDQLIEYVLFKFGF